MSSATQDDAASVQFQSHTFWHRAINRQRGGAQLMLFFAIVVALAAVSFALQNSVPVTVTFMVWRFDSSLAMVLLLAVSLGALAVSLIAWPTIVRERWALARERKRIVALETALLEAKRAVPALPKDMAHGQGSTPAS